MKRPATKADRPVVYIRRCEEYDRDAIMAIIDEGMQVLGYRPRGTVYAKPNVVFALGHDFTATAFTNPAFVGAATVALSRAENVQRVDVGENSAVGFPTRFCYSKAGYFKELARARRAGAAPIRLFCIDEDRRDRVFVGGTVHDVLRVSRTMARADCKVYLPKLKCHCVTTMTGAVKLNIGICSDDERAIRHDFMLNDKIVDLLAAGYPDLVIMDAIDIGVGNEIIPRPRRLGLVIMGTNPLAVDLVGSRLLGYNLDDVVHLRKAVERGYRPGSLGDIILKGDLTSVKDLDAHAKRIMPYDDDYTSWQDINKELSRLRTPITLAHGSTRGALGDRCHTGCVMGLKMFLGFMQHFAGEEGLRAARKSMFVVGRHEAPIDAGGAVVFLTGTCAEATINNARKVIRIDRCFTTSSDMSQVMPHNMGLPSPYTRISLVLPFARHLLTASFMKLVRGRYLQDAGHFMARMLLKKI